MELLFAVGQAVVQLALAGLGIYVSTSPKTRSKWKLRMMGMLFGFLALSGLALTASQTIRYKDSVRDLGAQLAKSQNDLDQKLSELKTLSERPIEVTAKFPDISATPIVASPKSTEKPRPDETTKPEMPVTMQNLFEKIDFDNYFRTRWDVEVPLPQGSAKTTGQVYADFFSRAKFIGIYVPGFRQDLEQIFLFWSDHFQAILSEKTRFGAGGFITEETTSSEELVFTGRVYLYYLGELSVEQKTRIKAAFEKNGGHVKFRGKEYWAIKESYSK